jgi:hypothetical protein
MLAQIVAILFAGYLAHLVDYRILKNRYIKSEKFDFNLSCGSTACEGINADIVKQDVPRFVLVNDVYHLPFKDKQFKNALCSHTMEHVDNPVKFFKELQRVSENVTILIPPVWDFLAMMDIAEHKFQFLTLRTMHKNRLPRFFKLPFAASFQKKFGQMADISPDPRSWFRRI